MTTEVGEADTKYHVQSLSSKLELSIIDQMQSTIDALQETIEKGELERNQLMKALNEFLVMSNAPDANSVFCRQHSAAASAQGSRHVSPQQRPISPLRRFARTNSMVERDHSAPRPASALDGWKHSYHADRAQESNFSVTYKQLLADNRAMIISIENLQREARKQEGVHEQRLRLMQRKITESTEQSNSLRERCLSLEAELQAVLKTRQHTNSISGALYFDPSQGIGKRFARSVSHKRF